MFFDVSLLGYLQQQTIKVTYQTYWLIFSTALLVGCLVEEQENSILITAPGCAALVHSMSVVHGLTTRLGLATKIWTLISISECV